jgi:hypothetical protein
VFRAKRSIILSIFWRWVRCAHELMANDNLSLALIDSTLILFFLQEMATGFKIQL